MAILVTEGFDWQAAAADLARNGRSVNLGTPTFVTGARGKGQALALNAVSTARVAIGFGSALSRVFVSMDMAVAFSAATTAAGNGCVSLQGPGGVAHLDFIRNSAGNMEVRRAGTLLATSSNTVFTTLATFRHVEIDATIDNSSGSVVVKVDGVTEINFSGDTQNSGTASVDTVQFRGASGDFGVYVDNLVIQDTTGSSPYNAPLGPVMVDGRLRPVSDVSVQGAPSTGGSNYAVIDEDYLSMADYVAFDASEADRYGISNLDYTPVTVYKVSVIALVNADSGGQEAQIEAHVGGNTTTGSSTIVPSTGSITLPMLTKPGGGSWTPSDVNGLEVTFERTA